MSDAGVALLRKTAKRSGHRALLEYVDGEVPLSHLDAWDVAHPLREAHGRLAVEFSRSERASTPFWLSWDTDENLLSKKGEPGQMPVAGWNAMYGLRVSLTQHRDEENSRVFDVTPLTAPEAGFDG